MLASGGASGLVPVQVGGNRFLSRSLTLDVGQALHPSLLGMMPTTIVSRVMAAATLDALLIGVLCLAVAIVLGILWSSQISRPVERLAAYSQRLARGEWGEPLELRSVRELEALVTALDRMRTDLSAYRDRLIVSERHPAGSPMAAPLGHEGE